MKTCYKYELSYDRGRVLGVVRKQVLELKDEVEGLRRQPGEIAVPDTVTVSEVGSGSGPVVTSRARSSGEEFWRSLLLALLSLQEVVEVTVPNSGVNRNTEPAQPTSRP